MSLFMDSIVAFINKIYFKDYLLLEEKHEANDDISSYKNQNKDSVISFDSVYCKWNDSDEVSLYWCTFFWIFV